MTKLTGALVACLGLGTADVAALNVWLLPGVVARPDAPRPAVAQPSAKPIPAPTPTPVAAPVPASAPVALAAAVPAPATVPTPVAAPADPEPVTRSKPDAMGILAFDKGSWRVGQRMTAAIERMADRLRDQAVSIEVAGHADATGTEEVNDRISELRAEAVARRLERAGIAKERIDVTHFGARRPAGLPNDRRVEILARAGP
jgi:outer membrane protein OmpA-like peptidoglycan-associated protein